MGDGGMWAHTHLPTQEGGTDMGDGGTRTPHAPTDAGKRY
ncbi:hypothetical protein NG2371_06179 [Nocardia gamkensis]|nr:hypothetical protein [Nocardia gamkensis]